MFDPRDDTRERGDDGRARAYEGRDRTGDPRDVFLRDVDLPLEREREYVLARDYVYELNGEESRTLATLGAFRVVPERDLVEGDDAQDVNDALDHLREQGLIDTVPIGDHDQGLVLTDRGHDLWSPTAVTASQAKNRRRSTQASAASANSRTTPRSSGPTEPRRPAFGTITRAPRSVAWCSTGT